MSQKPARLFCETGALAGTYLELKAETTIGRQPASDLVLYPHTVSSNHARIYFSAEDHAYYVEDLGSSNGTWVDRVRVNEPTKLDSLNVITFAKDIDFVFQILSGRPKGPAAPTRSPQKQSEKQHTVYQDQFAPPPNTRSRDSETTAKVEADKPVTFYQQSFTPPPNLTDDATSEGKTMYNKSFEPPPQNIPSTPRRESIPQKTVHLLVKTKETEERFVLKEGNNSVGRSSSCDITIQDPFISSNHAILQLKQGKLVLNDLKSSNKTYINGKAISEPVTLRSDMTIRFGPNSIAKVIVS